MKKILSFIICFSMTVSLLVLPSFAAPEFTMEDAEQLISSLEEIADILWEGHVDEFAAPNEVPADVAVNVMNSIHPGQYTVDKYRNLGVYYPAEQYKTPEYWKGKLNTFLTAEYTEKNFAEILDGGIVYYDGEIYVRTGVAVQSSAGYDTFDELKNKKITQDGDTACLEFLHELPYDRGDVKRKIKFAYTENGWRISGGDGVDDVLGIATNPNTSDIGTVISVCLFTSMLCMGITLGKKKRI